jgi:hypothetical protein
MHKETLQDIATLVATAVFVAFFVYANPAHFISEAAAEQWRIDHAKQL